MAWFLNKPYGLGKQAKFFLKGFIFCIINFYTLDTFRTPFPKKIHLF